MLYVTEMFPHFFQAFKFPDSMNVHFQCVVQVCRSQCPEPQCGGTVVPPRSTANTNQAYSQDSYGAPQGRPLAQDSYGAPQGAPLGQQDTYGAPLNPNINPRLPYSADDSFTAPGLFSKRTGEPASGPQQAPHGPRSLEDEDDWTTSGQVVDAKNTKEEIRNALENGVGDDSPVHNRKKRSAFTMTTTFVDEDGNEIASVHKREAPEMADVETAEKVIQVLLYSPLGCSF